MDRYGDIDMEKMWTGNVWLMLVTKGFIKGRHLFLLFEVLKKSSASCSVFNVDLHSSHLFTSHLSVQHLNNVVSVGLHLQQWLFQGTGSC